MTRAEALPAHWTCPDCGAPCSCSPAVEGIRHRRCEAPPLGDRDELDALPCADCGAPSVGWAYDVMGDGQTINGRTVCAAHLAGVPS